MPIYLPKLFSYLEKEQTLRKNRGFRREGPLGNILSDPSYQR